jgi:hypothetical protein
MAERDHDQEPEAFLTNTGGNETTSPFGYMDLGGEDPVSQVEIQRPAEKKKATSLAGSATGPRTPEGKEKSKRNAIKHGIFSDVVVLKGESATQFESLLGELWKALQPEGKLEEILVEKLVVSLWRQRRVIAAESAEIRKTIELLDFGLIQNIQDPSTLERCLELLAKLRKGIASCGFDQGRDISILRKIYDENYRQRNLHDIYLSWLKVAYPSEEGQPKRSGTVASPPIYGYTTEQCKYNFLREIDVEINRLEVYQKKSTPGTSDGITVKTLRCNIPDSPQLDHLLRYETTLSREIDRILNRLDRLQRMRKGQPPSPQVDVNIS